MHARRPRQKLMAVLAVTALASAAACRRSPPPAAATASPVYNAETGQLEALLSDRDGDGKVETRAVMQGTRLVRIEIDRNGDGTPDRWEHYAPPAPGAATAAPPAVERIEEANGPSRGVSRVELFEAGQRVRVEEDTDLDGRLDKWEHYRAGRLALVELDSVGRGGITERLHYGEGGSLTALEVDTDGDGRFEPRPVAPAPGDHSGPEAR